MRRPRTPLSEQYRLVMDCRQSGLSDTRWCEENGIHPSTFYNWVNRLRKRGCDIPAPASADDFLPLPHQDVVRVDLVPDAPFVGKRLFIRRLPINRFLGKIATVGNVLLIES